MEVKVGVFRGFILTGLGVLLIDRSVSAGEQYEPTRESLVNCEILEWYLDAKFGFWFI